MTEPLEQAEKIMRETRIAALTYVSQAGDLVSTPMGTQDLDDPGTVWFLTEVDTDKVRAIQADPRVNVHYASDEGWVSLVGTAELSMDRARLKELWDASASAFMSGGPEDDTNGLLRVSASSLEYWESPGAVASAFQMVKGVLTRSQPDLGDNQTIPLDGR